MTTPRSCAPRAHDLWLVLAIGLVVLAVGIGQWGPWPPDAPRFAAVAREILATGDWLLPRCGGWPYPDKPPLFLWIAAGILRLTGSPALSVALPSLFGALLTLVLVHDLAARLWNRRTAWIATVLLLSSAQFAWQARVGQVDMLLCGWTTLGLYGLARHLLRGPAWGWYTLAGAAMGLGVLSKGVGFLPLLALLPAAWLRGRGRIGPWGRPAGWAAAPLAMSAVVAAWLLPLLATAAGSPELAAYRDEILFHQTVTRYASAWHHTDRGWWYYPVVVIPALWLPVTLLLPWCLAPLGRRLRRGDPPTVLLAGWVLAGVVFFSLSTGKRGVYLLPLLPAAVLTVAPLWPGLLRRHDVTTVLRGGTILLGGLLTAGTLALLAGWRPAPDLPMPPEAVLAIGAVLGLALAASALVGPRRGVIARAAAALLATMALLTGICLPPLDPRCSARSFVSRIETLIAAEAEARLGMVGWKEQYLLHATRPVVTFGHRELGDAAQREVCAGLRWLMLDPRHRLLASADRLADLIALGRRTDPARPWLDPGQAIALGRQDQADWYLFSATDLAPTLTAWLAHPGNPWVPALAPDGRTLDATAYRVVGGR